MSCSTCPKSVHFEEGIMDDITGAFGEIKKKLQDFWKEHGKTMIWILFGLIAFMMFPIVAKIFRRG